MSRPTQSFVVLCAVVLALAGCGGDTPSAEESDAATDGAGGAQVTVGPMCDHVDPALLEEAFGAPPEVSIVLKPGDALPAELQPPGSDDMQATAHMCLYLPEKGSQDAVVVTVRDEESGMYEDNLEAAKKNTQFTKCKVEEGVLFGSTSYIERCSDGGEPFIRHTADFGEAFFSCMVSPPKAKDVEAVEALAAELCGGVVEAMSS